MVSVRERMDAQDAGVQCAHHSGAVECSHSRGAELVGDSVERLADLREVVAHGLGWAALDLSDPPVARHHTEEGAVLAEASATIRESAREDRTVPPPDALDVDLTEPVTPCAQSS